jgi:hypothetical protein
MLPTTASVASISRVAGVLAERLSADAGAVPSSSSSSAAPALRRRRALCWLRRVRQERLVASNSSTEWNLAHCWHHLYQEHTCERAHM